MYKALRVSAFRCTKVVKCKRLISIVNKVYDHVKVIECNDWQDGSKNFVFHQLRVEVRSQDNSRFDMLGLSIKGLSSMNDLAASRGDDVLHAVEMEFVHHLALS